MQLSHAIATQPLTNSVIKAGKIAGLLSQQEAIVALGHTFPCLSRFLPEPAAWSSEAFDRQACKMSSGESHAARFLLRVWNWHLSAPGAVQNWKCGVFDPLDACSVWDEAHRDAFAAWVQDPWWC